MKTTLTFLILFFYSLCSFAQIKEYLQENIIYLNSNTIKFNPDFYKHQIYFFGFVHGSATPQEVDFELLKHLHSKGVRYYAPEVDASLAFFLNKYLLSGDEDLLTFIVHFYGLRVPQDASVQFKEKWRKIYRWNKTLKESDKITVLGFDRPISKEVCLTNLAFLASDNGRLDRLKKFRTFDYKSINIDSGKPVIKSGKSFEYFFGNEKTKAFNQLQKSYENNPDEFLDNFELQNKVLAKHIFESYKESNREKAIFNNFNKIADPIFSKGEKLYCNYGYFHIQQELINGQKSFAKMIKDEGKYSIISIQGLLYNSACLDHVKLCFDKKVTIKDVEFKKMNYCGYKTSKTLDGDSFFERAKGIKHLKKVMNSYNIGLIDLTSKNSPFKEDNLLASFKPGGKNWKVEKNATTTEYFQYVIIMQNSKANIPYVEDN